MQQTVIHHGLPQQLGLLFGSGRDRRVIPVLFPCEQESRPNFSYMYLSSYLSCSSHVPPLSCTVSSFFLPSFFHLLLDICTVLILRSLSHLAVKTTTTNCSSSSPLTPEFAIISFQIILLISEHHLVKVKNNALESSFFFYFLL